MAGRQVATETKNALRNTKAGNRMRFGGNVFKPVSPESMRQIEIAGQADEKYNAKLAELDNTIKAQNAAIAAHVDELRNKRKAYEASGGNRALWDEYKAEYEAYEKAVSERDTAKQSRADLVANYTSYKDRAVKGVDGYGEGNEDFDKWLEDVTQAPSGMSGQPSGSQGGDAQGSGLVAQGRSIVGYGGETTSHGQNGDNQDGNQNGDNQGGDAQEGGQKGSYDFPLSETFYRNAYAALTGRPQGNQMDVNAAVSNAQNQNYKNRAADRFMEAQQHQQRGELNKYGEAGKIASMKNDAQNQQNVNNLLAESGSSGAALARVKTAPDVEQQQQIANQQLEVAAKQREAGNLANERATTERGEEVKWRMDSRDYDRSTDESDRLSKGVPGRDTGGGQTPQPQNPQAPQTPQDNTGGDGDAPRGIAGASPQHVINYIIWSNDPTSKNKNGSMMTDADWELYKLYGEPAPFTAEQVQSVQGGFNGTMGDLTALVAKTYPEMYAMYAEDEDWRNIGKANQVNAGDVNKNGEVLTSETINNQTIEVPQG